MLFKSEYLPPQPAITLPFWLKLVLLATNHSLLHLSYFTMFHHVNAMGLRDSFQLVNPVPDF